MDFCSFNYINLSGFLGFTITHTNEVFAWEFFSRMLKSAPPSSFDYHVKRSCFKNDGNIEATKASIATDA